MRYFSGTSIVLAALLASVLAQSPTTAPAPDAIPFTAVKGVDTTAVLDILKAVGGPSLTTVNPSQITALDEAFSAIEVSFFTNPIFRVDPSTLIQSGSEAPSASAALVSVLDGALATHNPAALPTIASLASGQPFASNLVVQVSKAFEAIASEKAAIGAAIEEELSVTPTSATGPGAAASTGMGMGMGGMSSSSSMALAAAPTAGTGVIGAAVGLAAGMAGVVLL